MRLLSVIPISRGIAKESLTYFTSADISAGSIIKVPLRKKVVPALVVSSEDASTLKTDIKNAPFEIKKIEKIKASSLLSPHFIAAIKETADYLTTTSGSVMHATIPKNILENADKISTELLPLKNAKPQEKQVVQSDDEERYATYKSLIREEFAKGYSVYFCLPTVQDIKKAYEKISKGIEQYTFVLHNSVSKKEVTDLWNKVTKEDHPVLLICTGQFLSIPRNDVGAIIVDKENSRSYKMQSRPFVDYRYFAEILAKKINSKVIFGDMLLRTETVWRHQIGELFEVSPLKFRSLNTSRQLVVDMKERIPDTLDQNKEGREPKFKILSDAFLNMVTENKLNDENMFVFVARRGLFPSTVCGDCGSIISCNTCGAPTVLHKAPTENFFLCHRCGEHRSALEKCKNCQSWRLGSFGIGIESVEEEIRTKFPDLKIFKIDADSASTHKKALDIIEKFYASPGSILLGTEMSLLYLTEKVANAAVVSIDSFFSIPDFRINERVLNILLRIKSLTSRNLLIQTRDGEQKIYKYAVQGNLADFYRDEIKDREQLGYPPFSTLIKITLQGDKKSVVAGMEKLQKYLEPFEVDIFPAFIPLIKGKFSMHGLIKIKRGEWVNEVLSKKLKSLPPNYIINIDPESLL